MLLRLSQHVLFLTLQRAKHLSAAVRLLREASRP